MVDLYGLKWARWWRSRSRAKCARFTVAGIWRDYARQQGSVIIERDRYIAYSGDRNSTDAALYLAPGVERRGGMAGDTRAYPRGRQSGVAVRPARSGAARSRCSTAPLP